MIAGNPMVLALWSSPLVVVMLLVWRRRGPRVRRYSPIYISAVGGGILAMRAAPIDSGSLIRVVVDLLAVGAVLFVLTQAGRT